MEGGNILESSSRIIISKNNSAKQKPKSNVTSHDVSIEDESDLYEDLEMNTKDIPVVTSKHHRLLQGKGLKKGSVTRLGSKEFHDYYDDLYLKYDPNETEPKKDGQIELQNVSENTLTEFSPQVSNSDLSEETNSVKSEVIIITNQEASEYINDVQSNISSESSYSAMSNSENENDQVKDCDSTESTSEDSNECDGTEYDQTCNGNVPHEPTENQGKNCTGIYKVSQAKNLCVHVGEGGDIEVQTKLCNDCMGQICEVKTKLCNECEWIPCDAKRCSGESGYPLNCVILLLVMGVVSALLWYLLYPTCQHPAVEKNHSF